MFPGFKFVDCYLPKLAAPYHAQECKLCLFVWVIDTIFDSEQNKTLGQSPG